MIEPTPKRIPSFHHAMRSVLGLHAYSARPCCQWITPLPSIPVTTFLPSLCECRFVHAGPCNSYVLAWYGMLPMQLAMSSLAVINAVMVCPVDPSPRQLYHHQCLQEVRAC